MIKLYENEKILFTAHRHWIIIFSRTILILLVGVAPLLGIPLLGSFTTFIPSTSILSFYFFLLTLYWLILLLVYFVEWLEYWLDAWIVTNIRVININQVGLFHREVSEFMLNRVQDVTVETPNMFASLLGFSNIYVQTAGELGFSIKTIPCAEEIKNLIMKRISLEEKVSLNPHR